ncbi:MAG: ferrous iron transporter B [Treponema sp.]|nr:ferrous iron transporter B [Treponema sp.]
MSAENPVIALLGQPNSGKSTLFNHLTGLHQHVGNWPGKTVEKKEGTFKHGDKSYKIADLPGSYSLSANSEEEVITRNYIKSGKSDLVIVMADASQLERSLYMLADFAELKVPGILVLNMMDVAEKIGKKIDAAKIEAKLGIPVIPFVAADKKAYPALYTAIEKALKEKAIMDSAALDAELAAAKTDNPSEKGNIKFNWIKTILDGAQTKAEQKKILGKIDKIATTPFLGKLLCIGVIILAIILSFIIAAPIMGLASMIPTVLCGPIKNLLTSWNVVPILTDLVSNMIPNVLYFALSMSSFVIGITFSFSLVEEIGFMARISYAFDNWMSKLGLQGKSIMAFFMGFGCTIGGAAGTRVIDNWGQRILALTLVWAVPCGATWALIPTLASIFFGKGAILIMISILLMMFVVMALTSKIFGNKLAPKNERVGMIMELPPYHKPRWGNLIKTTLTHTWEIFSRAIKVIFIVYTVFFLLSYSKTGTTENTILYKIGTAIEPVTKIFGLGWQTFMAFISSAVSKEAVLGVLSSLYTNSGSVFASTMGTAGVSSNLAEILPQVISKPEALAFIFSVTFNVPCLMAIASTHHETHKIRWTITIALYYTLLALLLSCIIFHVASLFWK